MPEKNKVNNIPLEHILVIGDDKLSCSLAVCLAGGIAHVTWFTSNANQGNGQLQKHVENLREKNWPSINKVIVTSEWPAIDRFDMIYISGQIPLEDIRGYISRIEQTNREERIIAIETVGLPLSAFQSNSQMPENIVGLNWSEPVHTTYFMEIIANEKTKKSIPLRLMEAGENRWKKDPYLVQGDHSIQERMMAALMREALFLVANGYALPSDIDKSCRNDGGSYLPFAGVFRYMDLMGTYLYGVVMGKLNKELSTDNSVGEILKKMITEGKTGMEAGEGFYSYSVAKRKNITHKMNAFAFEIRQLMEKYKGTDMTSGD